MIATKSKCNNDLHQGSFHISFSNITGHHHTLTSSLFLMILFTQSTAVLRKYLNDKLKILCYNLSLRLHRIQWEFLEFSIFREIPEYSRFVAIYEITTFSHNFIPLNTVVVKKTYYTASQKPAVIFVKPAVRQKKIRLRSICMLLCVLCKQSLWSARWILFVCRGVRRYISMFNVSFDIQWRALQQTASEADWWGAGHAWSGLRIDRHVMSLSPTSA